MYASSLVQNLPHGQARRSIVFAARSTAGLAECAGLPDLSSELCERAIL
jgi:hypothetical protein